MKFDINVWAKWAEAAGLDTRAINFMLMNPEVITERYNARSFVTFFNSISTIQKFEDELGLIQMLGEGCIGPEASTLFTSFINNKLDKLPSPEFILTNSNEQHVLTTLNDCVNGTGTYRADISSVLATRIINYGATLADRGVISNDVIKRLIKLTTDSEAFNDDLKYYIVKELIAAHKVKFSKLLNDAHVASMIMS